MHLNRGWCGIGYHFYIRKDGSVWRGRPEDRVGAHAYGANSDSLGVCFEGNFESEDMSQKQIEAGRALLADLFARYGLSAAHVIGHKDVCATACPGSRFPMATLLSGSAPVASAEENRVAAFQNAAIADGFSFPKYGADGTWGNECAGVAAKAIVKKQATYRNRNLTALVQRWLGITADGKCGKDTDAAIRAFQKAHGLTVDGAVGKNTWRALMGV